MAYFDYITDPQFRASLESDYKELDSSLAAENWKSAHVLAGSIVEALLIDHIIAEGLAKKEAALKLDLAGAIAKCVDAKVLSQRTADLSSVIRSYRNLIHPGRSIRLNELVDADSARIALSLVGIVI